MAQRTSARRYLAERIQQGIGFRSQTAGDGKVCDLCRSEAGKYKKGEGDGPPYHPNCRCKK